MLRRSFVVTSIGSLAAGCVQVPKRDPNAPPFEIPPDAPPPSTIRRLLVWLPSPMSTQAPASGGIGLYATNKVLFDNQAFMNQLRQKLQPYGVEIAVGTSSGLELDRRDEQKALVARLKPTHRLEVDVTRLTVTRSTSALGGGASFALMRWSLFDVESAKLVRSKAFGVNGETSVLNAHVDYAVEHLAAQGFL